MRYYKEGRRTLILTFSRVYHHKKMILLLPHPHLLTGKPDGCAGDDNDSVIIRYVK